MRYRSVHKSTNLLDSTYGKERKVPEELYEHHAVRRFHQRSRCLKNSITEDAIDVAWPPRPPANAAAAAAAATTYRMQTLGAFRQGLRIRSKWPAQSPQCQATPHWSPPDHHPCEPPLRSLFLWSLLFTLYSYYPQFLQALQMVQKR